MSNSKSKPFVPNSILARRGYLRMINPQTELVLALACPCGQIMPPSEEFKHKVTCKHPQSCQGKIITIPNPALIIIQTSRGSMVVEGLETQEEKSKFGPCPFPLAHPGVVVPKSNEQGNDDHNYTDDVDLHRGNNDDLL